MRNLVAGVVGLLLTAAFAISAGRGVALSFPLSPGTSAGVAGAADPAGHGPGLVWLLFAGLFLGLLVVGRRVSPVVPLVAGTVLLVATLAGLALPGWFGPGSPGGARFGMYVLNGYGLGVLFATLLLVVAVVPTGRRTSSAS